ncbi:transglutaminase TgpA family protein [Neptuniibacter halophilus]|uniref:transglutaminase TgpA family protein n=1 Tax=Neptuniibacter halophilus TaxID=651666 RepID=UPI0025741649|nr:DUF3488 and transglutaminase-like domain-containing protein [Neptuniibacter halophilus]
MISNLQLSRTALLWQMLSVLLVILPHLGHLPLWIPPLVLGALFWRFLVFTGRASFPPRWVKLIIVVAAGLGVLISFRSGGGISSTVSLLIIGFGLKMLEIYKHRDALVVLYVAYLVTAMTFLFSQTMLMGLYVLLTLLVISTALLCVYLPRNCAFWLPFKRVCLMFVPALPLMVVLFLGMPRIGPLWEMGLDQSAAKTGLAEEMSPGDISRLTRSAEVAFRVEFDKAPPPQSELYWRALVLNDFDGRRWKNLQAPALAVEQRTRTAGSGYRYQLILEATGKRYLPALDYPGQWPSEVQLNADQTLQSRRIINERRQWRLSSVTGVAIDADLEIFDLQRQLVVPDGNPQTRELAARWWRETGSYEAYLDRILSYYNQRFTYSLQPPLLGRQMVDQFLFQTQTGFCGHFAGATALMLRLAGIPARVVTGYQGGEWNPYDQYLLVRQYDAHAWVEAWQPGKGWQRIDPTAAVAPQRVEQPAEGTLSLEAGFLADNPLVGWTLKRSGVISSLRLRLEALNYGWHQWVLNYHHNQASLLSSLLGQISYLKLALFLLLPFTLVIGVTTLLMMRSNRPKSRHKDDLEIIRFSEALGRHGLSRAPGETVQHYCRRLAEIRPELQSKLTQLAQRYEQLRYAPVPVQGAQASLKPLVDDCLAGFR